MSQVISVMYYCYYTDGTRRALQVHTVKGARTPSETFAITTATSSTA